MNLYHFFKGLWAGLSGPQPADPVLMFVVSAPDNECENMYGIYSTLERAQAARRAHGGQIDEWRLDNPEHAPDEMLYYTACFDFAYKPPLRRIFRDKDLRKDKISQEHCTSKGNYPREKHFLNVPAMNWDKAKVKVSNWIANIRAARKLAHQAGTKLERLDINET